MYMVLSFLIVSCLCIGGSFFFNKTISHLITFLYSFVLLGFVCFFSMRVGIVYDTFFMVDNLSLLFLWLTVIISFLSGIHYKQYAEVRQETDYTIRLHNAGTIIFYASITGVLTTNNFGFLWVFIEATTLSASLLIYHDRDKGALEATWKYLYVCSIGVALAFAGILFLTIAVNQTTDHDLSYEVVKKHAYSMNPLWLKTSFLFILTGFSVKMGLVPLFNVDIDAKDVAPSPVGANLSSVMLNAAFVTILRFYYAYTPIQEWMNKVLLITGVLSLLFASVYLLKVKNIKRLLAYSGMEHASLAVIAFACGGIGYFASVLHLVFHSLIKSVLFFQIGQMHSIFHSKIDDSIGNYIKINPIGALVILLGTYSLLAFPPTGIFFSEFLILKSIFLSHHYFILGITMVFLIIILYGIIHRIIPIIYSSQRTTKVELSAINKWHSIIQLLVILSVMYMGITQFDFLAKHIHKSINPFIP